MKFAVGIVVLAIALAVAKLRSSDVTSIWTYAGVMVAAGLVVIVIAWILAVWIRTRERRRLMETRDSALW